MKPVGIWRLVICSIALLATLTPTARADDRLIVATAQHGRWEAAAAELGQEAGIFKKHGLVLEFQFAQTNSETEKRVISGAAEVGLGAGALQVMRAYASGAPVRIISAHTAGSTNYWYVLKSSPIQSAEDFDGRVVAYESNGSSSQYDAIDLSRHFDLTPRLVSTGDPSTTFNLVKAGRIDVGWAAAPFGVDKILAGDIRIVARANNVPKIRNKTTGVMIANADTLHSRKNVLVRFLQAYQEAIEWMYSDPAALHRYAEFANIPDEAARLLRDELFPKEMLLPGRIVGLNAIAKDAINLRYLQKVLSQHETANLVQIAAPVSATNASILDWSFLDSLGQRIIVKIERVTGLSTIISLMSLSAALVAAWVMRVTGRQAGSRSSVPRLALAQRIGLAMLAISLMLNAVTPFITSDPPWLASLPLIAAIIGFLLCFGLSQTRAKQGRGAEPADPKGGNRPPNARLEGRKTRSFSGRPLTRLWRA